MRTVTLRRERSGPDLRSLIARLTSDGELVIEGQDLGPATAMISSNGEYEWGYNFPSGSIPALHAALGGQENEDVLDVLERSYTGEGSYELERIMRETEESIPRSFWSWAG